MASSPVRSLSLESVPSECDSSTGKKSYTERASNRSKDLTNKAENPVHQAPSEATGESSVASGKEGEMLLKGDADVCVDYEVVALNDVYTEEVAAEDQQVREEQQQEEAVAKELEEEILEQDRPSSPHSVSSQSHKYGEEAKTKRVESQRRRSRSRSASQERTYRSRSRSRSQSRTRERSRSQSRSRDSASSHYRARSKSKPTQPSSRSSRVRDDRGDGEERRQRDDDEDRRHRRRSHSSDSKKDNFRSSRSKSLDRDNKKERHRSRTSSRDTNKQSYRSKSNDDKKDSYRKGNRRSENKRSATEQPISVENVMAVVDASTGHPTAAPQLPHTKARTSTKQKPTTVKDVVSVAAAATAQHPSASIPSPRTRKTSINPTVRVAAKTRPVSSSPRTRRESKKNIVAPIESITHTATLDDAEDDPLGAILAMNPRKTTTKTQQSGQESMEQPSSSTAPVGRIWGMREAFKLDFPGVPLPSDSALQQRYKGVPLITFQTPQPPRKRLTAFSHNPHISPTYGAALDHSRKSLGNSLPTLDYSRRSMRVIASDRWTQDETMISNRTMSLNPGAIPPVPVDVESSPLSYSERVLATTNTANDKNITTSKSQPSLSSFLDTPCVPFLQEDHDDPFADGAHQGGDTRSHLTPTEKEDEASLFSYDVSPKQPKRQSSNDIDEMLKFDESEQEKEEEDTPSSPRKSRMGIKLIASKVVKKSKSVFEEDEMKKQAKKAARATKKEEKQKQKKVTAKENEGDNNDDAWGGGRDGYLSPKTMKRRTLLGAAKSRAMSLIHGKGRNEKDQWGALPFDDGSCSVGLADSDGELENEHDQEENEKLRGSLIIESKETMDENIMSASPEGNSTSAPASRNPTSTSRSPRDGGIKGTFGAKSEPTLAITRLDMDGEPSPAEATFNNSKEQSEARNRRSSKATGRRNTRRSSTGVIETEDRGKRSGHVRSASPHGVRSSARIDRRSSRHQENARSRSPGAFRGDIARKRNTMNEIRKKRSSRHAIEEEEIKPRRSETTVTTKGSTTRELLPSPGEKSSDDSADLGLDELVKQVKVRAESKKKRDQQQESASSLEGSLPRILGLIDGGLEW